MDFENDDSPEDEHDLKCSDLTVAMLDEKDMAENYGRKRAVCCLNIWKSVGFYGVVYSSVAVLLILLPSTFHEVLFLVE